jgi:regulator of protease activity HflC (stomatin/prohibitin superfamily)
MLEAKVLEAISIGMITFAAFTLIAIRLVGYFGQNSLAACIVFVLPFVGWLLSFVATILGLIIWGGADGAWIGLLVGIVPAGLLLGRAFSMITRQRQSGRFASGLWIGFWSLSMFSYWAGGWLGLLTIALPVIALFWVELYRISGLLLPLHDKGDREERTKAFRSLLTFTLGTNYPYYFVDENGQLVKRVDGNSNGQAFAGPGFVYTGCHHAVYVHDALFVKGVSGPGLTFTGMYDVEPRLIDLRPQLRTFPVEALTKDGIPIKVVTFIPYRIDSGNQAIEPGQSFPFREAAVYEVLASELVERKANKNDGTNGQTHKWDGGPEDGLVPLLVTPIVQDIIGQYTVDELCAPLDPERDPRGEITAEIIQRVKEDLRPRGLEVIGGGIGNLEPQEQEVTDRRLDNWRTKWAGRISTRLSESQAQRMKHLEMARVSAEVKMVKLFEKIISAAPHDNLRQAIAFGLIDAMGHIVDNGHEQYPLPNKEIEETLKRLRGESEGEIKGEEQ